MRFCPGIFKNWDDDVEYDILNASCDYLQLTVGGGLVAKSCLTPCVPMDFSPPGSSVHKILRGRILD